MCRDSKKAQFAQGEMQSSTRSYIDIDTEWKTLLHGSNNRLSDFRD